LRSFKWCLNHDAIGCVRSLNMIENTFVNHIFAIRLFHGQAKIGAVLITFRPPCMTRFVLLVTIHLLHAMGDERYAKWYSMSKVRNPPGMMGNACPDHYRKMISTRRQ
jgi:hypothetical protein